MPEARILLVDDEKNLHLTVRHALELDPSFVPFRRNPTRLVEGIPESVDLGQKKP